MGSTLRRVISLRFRITLLLLLGAIVWMVQLLKRQHQSLASSYLESTPRVLDQASFSLPANLTVAYAISITFCHPDDFMADAAGVLKHSIHLLSSQTPASESRYDYQMYAFVHPEAQNCTRSLQRLGYHVLIKNTPIQVDEIENLELREDATTTGCCQEKEFLKLHALTLTEHPIVVHLDLDCLLLQPLDPLFDAMMLPDSQEYYRNNFQSLKDDPNHKHHPPIRKYIPDAMWTPEKTIPITAYFTRDYNMVKKFHAIPPNRINVQGGFWIVQPNRRVFRELVDIVRDGHDYTSRGGWGGSRLRPSACYGVAQIQGLLSYYYGFVRPGSSVELNKCSYNNMVDQPRPECHASNLSQHILQHSKGQCQDCRVTPLEEIRSLHFTLCQKPWWCPMWIREPQCSRFHHQWHRIRRDFEVYLRLRPPQIVGPPIDTADMQQVMRQFPGHCTRQGSKGYRPIRFPQEDEV